MCAQPVTETEFSRLMDAVGPFGPAPRLAVAVSGGGDSMALCLLAHRWCRSRGGFVTALTVDHGLRADSAEDGRQVGRWLRGYGIHHRVLTSTEPRPASGLQAAARQARYALLETACRRAGLFHLLVAHTLDDQAETVLLRAASGSGPDGLAAMSPVTTTAAVAIVRPLLTVPRMQLRTTLQTFGQAWLEDPANASHLHTRVRLRGALAGLENAADVSPRLAVLAARLGKVRDVLHGAEVAAIAAICDLHPAGFAWLEAEGLSSLPPAMGRRVLARTIASVGGRRFPPARTSLIRCLEAVTHVQPRALTLGGCRLVPGARMLLVCRENRGLPAAAAAPTGEIWWDRRFLIHVGQTAPGPARHLARLGRDGWAAVRSARPSVRTDPIPDAARRTLPALWDDAGIFQVPHLAYKREDAARTGTEIVSVSFRPSLALSGVDLRLA